jgi:predicted lipid-binding transport protein (Tim44 family)
MLSRSERRHLAEIERELQDDDELVRLTGFFTTLARLDREARVSPLAASPLDTPAPAGWGGSPSRGRNAGAWCGGIAWAFLLGAGMLIMFTCTGAPLVDATVLLLTPLAFLGRHRARLGLARAAQGAAPRPASARNRWGVARESR